MSTVEFGQLEQQIDHLLRRLELSQSENQILQRKLSDCTKERAYLTENNLRATENIKEILARLKEEWP